MLYIFGKQKCPDLMFKIDLKLTVCTYVHKANVKVICPSLDDHYFYALEVPHIKMVSLESIHK